MKKIIIFIVIILLLIFLFPKSYISSPGFTTKEGNDEFQKTKKGCIGISFLTNTTETWADAPGESICLGILVK